MSEFQNIPPTPNEDDYGFDPHGRLTNVSGLQRRLDHIRAVEGNEAGHYADAPERLTQPIGLKKWPYENGNPYSPTPLDPYNVTSKGVPYIAAAYGFMMHLLHENTRDLELPEADFKAIAIEIGERHLLQSERNQRSFSRLCRVDPTRLTAQMYDIIDRVRSGTAMSAERISLLSLCPEMEAIEDYKFTGAVLDEDTYKQGMDAYAKALIQGQSNTSEGYRLIAPHQHSATSKVKDVSDNAANNIFVIKSAFAEIESRGVLMEAVERKSHIVLPASINLPGRRPHFYTTPSGTTYNMQPVAGSVYLRIKGQNTEADTGSLATASLFKL